MALSILHHAASHAGNALKASAFCDGVSSFQSTAEVGSGTGSLRLRRAARLYVARITRAQWLADTGPCFFVTRLCQSATASGLSDISIRDHFAYSGRMIVSPSFFTLSCQRGGLPFFSACALR